ncbi:hypothetical protein CCP1ISM_830002 [Azospirillaceae bacterium]
MALGFLSDAWKEVKGAVEKEVDNLKSYFKKDKGGSKLYPRDIAPTLIQEVNSKNWNKSLAYSFFVKAKNSGVPSKHFQEFKLQLNPQNITQDENFAINITPTQDAIISEHNGIVLRDLTISGTTGVNPNRGSTGSKADGRVITSQSSRTGYEEFNHLRNYLRAYSTYKKNIKNNGMVLTFLNRKDGEELIVEPIRFSMKRSGNRGPLYDYNIQFKIIGSRNFKDPDKKDTGFFASLQETIGTINDTLAAGRAVLLRSSDLLRQVEREINNTIFEPLRQLELLIKTLGGLNSQLGDMGDGLVARFDNSLTLNILKQMTEKPELAASGIVFPVNLIAASAVGGSTLLALRKDSFLAVDLDESNLTSELAKDFVADRQKILALPKSFFEDLRATSQRVADNATEFFGLGDPSYNAYAERPQTFVPSPTKQTTTQELEILFAFSQIQQAINLLLAYGNEHFQSNLEQKFSDSETNFNDEISIPFPSSVNEVVIAPGQSVEDLATQYLDDFSRWPEIVQLNNLIPPFITDSSTNSRIKAYGQRIMIPSDDGQIDTNVIVVREDKFNKKLTETEKRLGIDIKLNDQFDFILNNNNDYEVITGGNNAGQAIRIKFNLTKGDLRYHKTIGIGVPIGEKITNADMLYDEIVNTILQDPRFEKINDFDLMIDGGTIVVKLNLNVVESATPVPLTLNL